MKLTVISAWYNEELIAPFFLAHYLEDNEVDEIIILLDEDTTDNTRCILSQYSKVKVLPIKYPNGFDDIIKVAALNNTYRTVTDGWCIIVDSDEFVFGLHNTIRDHIIENDPYTVIKSELWHNYRNVNDNDLDSKLRPIVYQRRFGIKQNQWGDAYTKPILIKAGQNVSLSVGQHIMYGECQISHNYIAGAHWQYADPSIVLNRHTKNRKDRLSPENIAGGLSKHFLDFTEENVLKECEEHLHDERLF